LGTATAIYSSIMFPKIQVVLSRRNLEVLLSKLDRVKNGESSACTIIKRHNPDDGIYATSEDIAVIAVEDEIMYANRPAGAMHPADEVKNHRHTTGVEYAGPIL
jgi:hypothetical protein